MHRQHPYESVEHSASVSFAIAVAIIIITTAAATKAILRTA